MPMPSAVASLGSLIFTVSPFLRISPSSGWYRPNSTLISVDFARAVFAQQRVDLALAAAAG